MINSSPPQSSTLGSEEGTRRRDRLVPVRGGAIAVAGIATAIVIALWFAFYLLVSCRGAPEHDDGEGHGIAEAVAERVKRRWATLSIVIVGVLVGMAAFIGIHEATMPQGRVETADPKTLHLSGEFVESNLGSALEPDGSITVRAIGQQYSFTPQCVVVPSDTPVTFRATSADVVHGLLIEGHQHQHHAGAGLYFRAADQLQGYG